MRGGGLPVPPAADISAAREAMGIDSQLCRLNRNIWDKKYIQERAFYTIAVKKDTILYLEVNLVIYHKAFSQIVE